MNIKRTYCFCGNELLRMSAHTQEGRIQLGYYCPVCKVILDLDILPMVPYRVPFHIEADPTTGVIRDLFPVHWQKVIIKMLENPNVRSLPDQMMRKLFLKPDPYLENQVRQQEIKEAADNQKIVN